MDDLAKSEAQFAQEWPRELSEEVGTPNKDRLPVVPDRVEVAAILASQDPLEQLAFRTLYETGMREVEFLLLSRSQLQDGWLNVAGRRVLIWPETLKQLHQLPDGGQSLFGWEAAELQAFAG